MAKVAQKVEAAQTLEVAQAGGLQVVAAVQAAETLQGACLVRAVDVAHADETEQQAEEVIETRADGVGGLGNLELRQAQASCTSAINSSGLYAAEVASVMAEIKGHVILLTERGLQVVQSMLFESRASREPNLQSSRVGDRITGTKMLLAFEQAHSQLKRELLALPHISQADMPAGEVWGLCQSHIMLIMSSRPLQIRKALQLLVTSYDQLTPSKRQQLPLAAEIAKNAHVLRAIALAVTHLPVVPDRFQNLLSQHTPSRCSSSDEPHQGDHQHPRHGWASNPCPAKLNVRSLPPARLMGAEGFPSAFATPPRKQLAACTSVSVTQARSQARPNVAKPSVPLTPTSHIRDSRLNAPSGRRSRVR